MDSASSGTDGVADIQRDCGEVDSTIETGTVRTNPTASGMVGGTVPPTTGAPLSRRNKAMGGEAATFIKCNTKTVLREGTGCSKRTKTVQKGK